MTAADAPTVLKLRAVSARDMMVPNPISIRATATATEAMTLLAEKAIAAAPVIDDTGRPIGVISRSDLFIHQLEEVRRHPHEYFTNPEVETRPAPSSPPANSTQMTVSDLMTPAVFAVSPAAPVSRVVSDLVGMHVHRLFVIDDDGVLVGVITAMDVLRHLQP